MPYINKVHWERYKLLRRWWKRCIFTIAAIARVINHTNLLSWTKIFHQSWWEQSWWFNSFSSLRANHEGGWLASRVGLASLPVSAGSPEVCQGYHVCRHSSSGAHSPCPLQPQGNPCRWGAQEGWCVLLQSPWVIPEGSLGNLYPPHSPPAHHIHTVPGLLQLLTYTWWKIHTVRTWEDLVFS